MASVALLEDDGKLIVALEESAPMAASGACLRMLEAAFAQSGLSLSSATLFLSDLGPGSFTGVRVGVTLAKTFAYAQGCQAGGASSFDLIDAESTVVLPNKRDEWFVRRPGRAPELVRELPSEDFVGFGPGVSPAIFPSASKFGLLLKGITPIAPELLVPAYIVDPAISKPKQPYASGVPGSTLPGTA